MTLEHIDAVDGRHTFRVAFSDSDSRILLPYPQVTGIRFLDPDDSILAELKTRYLSTSPLDDFVLTPDARIAFDLRIVVNDKLESGGDWKVDLPVGRIRARFHYHVDDKRDWYDFLAKRSRFSELTPPWKGTLESNTIEFVNNVLRNVG